MTLKLNKANLFNTACLAFAVFPLLPNGLKGLPVILLGLTALINFKPQKINYKWFFINTSFFLLFLISLLYTDNINYGLKKIETGMSIFIIPAIFFIILPKKQIEDTLKRKFMKLFIISTSFFSAITLIVIATDTKTEYWKDFYSNKFRIIVEELPLIGQHPIYASIFIGIALIFLTTLYKQKVFAPTRLNYVYTFIGVLINLSLIIMLSSRGVIISLILLIIVYLLRTLVLTKNYKYVIRIGAVVVISTIILLIFNRRMNEMIRFETYSTVNTNFSNSYRVGIYKCALRVIQKSVLIGHGVGDEQDELNTCYSEESELLFKKRHNSHNQYLDFCIKLGLIGLISFLIFLYCNFILAKRTQNEVLFYIILFYCLIFLTENTLVRQSGIIPFIFFIHFFRRDSKRVNN